MYPIVLFEGLDRTGKTTIAQRVARDLGGVYLHSPPSMLTRFRKYFDQADSESSFSYYLVGNHILNIQVEKFRKKRPVFLDRHFPSTVAFHSIKLGRDLGRYLSEMNPWPDRTYFFMAELDIIEQRAMRTESIIEGLGGREIWRRELENYERIFAGDERVVRVDTSQMGVDETFDFVMQDLRTNLSF